jgi:hypothetical protein
MKAWRIATVIAVGAAIIFGATGPAGAGDGPPSITLTIDPTSGPAGTAIAASGECFEDSVGACDGVIVSLIDPTDTVVDEFSIFENEVDYAGELTVPDDATCGEYTVLAEGDENETIIVDTSATFQVTTDCPPPTSEEPPPTDAPSTSAAAAAAAATRPTFTG